MVKPASVVAALLAVPVLALSACSTNQNPSSEPGTTPPVWTGSTSPSASPTHGPDGQGQKLTAQLSTPDGKPVATATFDFAGGFATITVETIGDGILTPGFHGMHIHSVGKCEANSAAPTGGPPGDFLSAGGHLQVPGHTGHPASGDLTSLQVRSRWCRQAGDHHRRVHRRAAARPGRAPRSSSTRRRTTSPTSRTATPTTVRTRRHSPPATPASGWLAVSSPASKPLARRRIDFAASPRPTRRGGMGVRARRRPNSRPLQRSGHSDRRDRREPEGAQGTAAQHRRIRHRCL